MSFQLKFGSLVLDDMKSWREVHASRALEHTVPRRPGSIAPRVPTPESRKISVVGEIWADTEAALKTRLEDIRHTLTDLGRDRLVLWDDNRYLNAIKESFNYSFVSNLAPSVRADIEIGFLADDPYWYAPSTSEVTANLTGTIAVFSVTNNGKARTPPVFEIIRTGAGTDYPDVVLTNTTTGMWVKWAGTFILGNKLVFDMVNRRVLMAGALVLNAVTGSVNMNLEPGLNNFNYTGAGNVSVTTAWIERWS